MATSKEKPECWKAGQAFATEMVHKADFPYG